ncbi:MAG TPA: aminoglycoside phosphotransferase family protein [Anaerolineales bacterium]|nr:aminoglycoside phosphotransferase family protein [Anaerolineales bacterium]
MKLLIVPIYEPSLDLLRQAFGNSIQDCHAELIKIALGWSRVYRVTMSRTAHGHSSRDSVVVKTADPNGIVTPLAAIRELRYYEILHPKLFIPKPELYYLTTDEATGFHVIVMEDLSATHRIPTHPYQWTYEELKSVLRAYAYLHTCVVEHLDYPWLAPRHENALDFEQIPEQVDTVQRAGIWGELPGLSDLIAYARESCDKYADTQLALLHGDTTPANASLPHDLTSTPATLIDWQDVGVGMPEFDLAYIDLQPFESGRGMPRAELLDLYWCLRSEIDSEIPPPRERRLRQLHADVVFALWLTRTASRVAVHPFPEGTYPHMHWSSQFGIVYNRLKTLTQEISKQS